MVKIRWLGPALVVLREDDSDRKPYVYWISHGTQLLRCAPHHVRQDFRSVETSFGGLEVAREVVASLKSRGVTRFLDLDRFNKRNIDEVDQDEEAMDDGLSEPATRRPRLDLGDFGAPTDDDGDSGYAPTTPGDPPDNKDSVVIFPPSPEVHRPQQADDQPQGRPLPAGTPAHLPPLPPDQLRINTEQNTPMDTSLDGMEILDQLEREDETEPGLEPSAPPSVRSQSPHGPAELPAQPSTSPPALDPEIAALYESAGPEDFRAMRSRIVRRLRTMDLTDRFVHYNLLHLINLQLLVELLTLMTVRCTLRPLPSLSWNLLPCLLAGLLMRLDCFNCPIDALISGKSNLGVSFDIMCCLGTTSFPMRRTKMPPLARSTSTQSASL